MSGKLRVHTGLSVRIAGVILAAVLSKDGRTARIEQRGETQNGDGEAIAAARQRLAERVKRTWPMVRVIP